jgi:phospholipid/cholesterol/gamma-HCH transport system substrate-binding protein
LSDYSGEEEHPLTANEISGASATQAEQAVPEQAGKRQVRIGLFVLGGLIATTILLFRLTDPSMFRGRYRITTTVDNVMGLRTGDPVQMRGVTIGSVNDFELGGQGDNVVIVLEVDGQWLIPEGSTTQLVQPGLMAPRTVEVLPGPGPGTMGSGDNMPGIAVKGLLDDTETLGEKGQIALDAIADLLSEKNLDAFSGSAQGLDNLVGELSDLLESERESLTEVIESFRRAADGLEEATGPELREDLASLMARGDSAMGRINTTSESIEGVAASLETILARIQNGEGTLGKLWASDSLFTDLTAAVESARTLIDDIRENPGRYLSVSIF